jgi:hypothetical protein
VIKQVDGWWIGWLVDLPGVNAQEKTRKELLVSLRIGAKDMLARNVQFSAAMLGIVLIIVKPCWNRHSPKVSGVFFGSDLLDPMAAVTARCHAHDMFIKHRDVQPLIDAPVVNKIGKEDIRS